MQRTQKPRFRHRGKPAAVPVRGGSDAVLRFHIDLAVIIGRRRHILTEEPDLRRIISEVMMLLHKTGRCFMVLLAGHDKERNKRAVRLADNVHQILDQPLHDIDMSRNADIIHALGIVAA